MYSEQFNEFLDLILEDGIVTQQERDFIHKKATAEGIDVDEIDIIIDSKLSKLNNKQTTEPSAELKEFIELTTSDGVISEKERNILIKKAAAEGISEQQLDNILKDILGNIPTVDTTPKPCGKPSQDFMLFLQMVASDGKITEQEYDVIMKKAERENLDKEEVAVLLATYQQKTSADIRAKDRNMDNNSSLNRLMEKMSKIESEYEQGKKEYEERKRQESNQRANNMGNSIISSIFNVVNEVIEAPFEDKRTEKKVNAIKECGLPKDKVDLLEFIAYCKSNGKDPKKDPYASAIEKAYFAKYEECLALARTQYKSDPDFKAYQESLFGKLFG